MTNQQLYLAMAFPSAIAFIGVLTSLVTFFVANSGINKRLDKIEATLSLMQRDLNEFYTRQGIHEHRLNVLEGKRG